MPCLLEKEKTPGCDSTTSPPTAPLRHTPSRIMQSMALDGIPPTEKAGAASKSYLLATLRQKGVGNCCHFGRLLLMSGDVSDGGWVRLSDWGR